jgi:hypothetical protein
VQGAMLGEARDGDLEIDPAEREGAHQHAVRRC